MSSRTVIYVHGMFMTALCWRGWVNRAEARGLSAQAPPWPGRDLPVDELRRRHPDPALAALTLDAVVAHYEQIIRALPAPPILIGHSMGGLIVQLLLSRGLGACGVAIDSAPPQGLISLKSSFLKSNWGMINPFAKKSVPYFMPFPAFCYAFVHTLPPTEQRAAYDEHVVPESRLVGSGPTTKAAHIDFQAKRAPLLFIAGEDDQIVPASLNRSNYEKYRGNPSLTEWKEFPGRVHYLLGQKGWEEVADYALAWAEKQ